ncbi:hypothetical protein ACTXG7_15870 [Mycolicibacterium sp. Dal123E01]|uniref:hypothetical protein n=1 Tax=Mycolicibacterium sp. Dal123E01 TaxID=3457578 RepID=UPI00403E656C
MALIKTALTVAVLAVGLSIGAAPAYADPPPPDQNMGEVAPDWAPRKPAEMWANRPVVWTHMWGGRWGVWINDQFITLSSNPVTNGG